jgi:HEAT repeat protein
MQLFLWVAVLVQEEPVEALVDRWRAGDLEGRERATSELLSRWKTLTEKDHAALGKALSDPDSEVAERAREVRGRVRLRRQLGERLVEALPWADANFHRGKDADKALVLHEAQRLFEEGRLSPRDLDGLRDAANEAAWENPGYLAAFREYRISGLRVALDPLERDRHRARKIDRIAGEGKAGVLEILPHLRDESAEVRSVTLRALGRAGAVEQAPSVRGLLVDGRPELRWESMEILAGWGRTEYAGDFARLLRDPNGNVRAKAAEALGTLGAARFADEVESLLQDVYAPTRAEAAAALGIFGAKGSAAKIAGLLADPMPVPRRSAVFALGRLGAADYAPLIVPLLEDSDLWVRIGAVQALGGLGRKEHHGAILGILREEDENLRSQVVWVLGGSGMEAGPVAERLQHRDAGVRHAALGILGRLDAVAYAHLVARSLEDPSGWVRARAAWALGRLGAREHAEALSKRLGDEDRRARIEAALGLGELAARTGADASALRRAGEDPDRLVAWAARTGRVRLGLEDEAGRRALLRDVAADSVARPVLGARVAEALAAALEQAAWAKLDRPLVPGKPVATWKELDDVLRDAGLRLEPDIPFPPGRFEEAASVTARRAIERLAGWDAVIVPEGDRLRLMTEAASLEHWARRLNR